MNKKEGKRGGVAKKGDKSNDIIISFGHFDEKVPSKQQSSMP
jgi:hypothetical protein